MLDMDELAELRAEERFRVRSQRCQCNVEWGVCPGPANCPFSGVEQGEDDAEFQSGDEGSR